jgi:glycosyltransferase involved in cell wall biosynthesis
MPKILFACLHRPDRSPSQRYRFEQYIKYLEEQGYSSSVSYLLDEQDDRIFYASGHYLGKLLILLKAVSKRLAEVLFKKLPPVVFVQRESFMLGTAFFEKCFAKRTRLIFDFDDSIWLQQVSEGNKKLAFLKNAGKTKEIIRAAHLVIAGNEYLADYARNYNPGVIIIPSTIDTDKYGTKEITAKENIVIGWSGSFSTIAHFESAVEALQLLKNKYGNRLSFMVIGDPAYYNERLSIKGLPWNAETEVEDLHRFDIGIMPLPDDEWTRGKCGMKGLQYMAAGIPTVMSPVGVNKEIINDGENGFLAGNTEEWVEKLSKLIESVELRKKFSYNGRKTVEGKYSVFANKERYLEAIRRVMGEEV